MNDKELKDMLTETWPIRPGQEGRAWSSLQASLGGKTKAESVIFSWPRLACGGLAMVGLSLVRFRLGTPSAPLLSADSQSPGIFATAFYSQPARAQVVWLNGMDPATDGPTYMDPTTKINEASPSSARPDRL
jgi:hypothetical protein